MVAYVDDMFGQVAVITGGASGIGLAMAHAFGAAGAKVVIGDIEVGALNTASNQLSDIGIECLAVECDVSSWEQVDALADATYARFGAANVVCNNAGVVTSGATWEQSLSDWKWVLDIDLWGVIHGIKAFVPRMVAAGTTGHIVNTGSTAGILGFANIAPYVAAKQAVVGLSESLLNDLRARKIPIGVSALCPGVVRTFIGSSERNRIGHGLGPNILPLDAPEALDPSDVAEQVLAAIRSGTFWILPHERYVEMFVERAESARRRVDPPVPFVKR